MGLSSENIQKIRHLPKNNHPIKMLECFLISEIINTYGFVHFKFVSSIVYELQRRGVRQTDG